MMMINENAGVKKSSKIRLWDNEMKIKTKALGKEKMALDRKYQMTFFIALGNKQPTENKNVKRVKNGIFVW